MTDITEATVATDVVETSTPAENGETAESTAITESPQAQALTPEDLGATAARAAMKALGRPGAIAWLIQNSPSSISECTPTLPVEWWLGFDAELSSVAGTA